MVEPVDEQELAPLSEALAVADSKLCDRTSAVRHMSA